MGLGLSSTSSYILCTYLLFEGIQVLPCPNPLEGPFGEPNSHRVCLEEHSVHSKLHAVYLVTLVACLKSMLWFD